MPSGSERLSINPGSSPSTNGRATSRAVTNTNSARRSRTGPVSVDLGAISGAGASGLGASGILCLRDVARLLGYELRDGEGNPPDAELSDDQPGRRPGRHRIEY